MENGMHLNRARWVVLSVIAFASAMGAFYRSMGFEAMFLMGESGYYLTIAHEKLAVIWRFVSPLLTHSYGGHYAPIPFMAELLQARALGANEALWFWRQMLVLGVFATCLLFMARMLGRSQGLHRGGLCLAVSVATIFIVQPMVIELAVWPFMLFQFLCLSCAAASIYFLSRFSVTAANKDFGGFLFSAYVSMHTFGVGFAFSAAALLTGLTIALMLLRIKARSWRGSRAIFWLLAASLLLTIVHAIMMLRVQAEPPFVRSVTASENVVRFGSLFIDSLWVGARALFGNGGFVWPRADVHAMQSIYGFGLMFTMFIGVGFLGARFLRRRNPADLAIFGALTFGLLAYCIYISLCVVRTRNDPGAGAMLGFLIGSRYVIFPAFFVLIFGLSAALFATRGLGILLAASGAISTITCISATAVFASTVVPIMSPSLRQPQQKRWNEIVSQARVDVNAGRALKNVGLRDLNPGLAFDLKMMRVVLERSLGCSGCVRFEGE